MAASEWVLETPAPRGLRIAYGDRPQQFGELRLPDGPGPHPVVLAIHGGFWKARYDLGHLGHACEALRAEGLASFSIEYRKVGEPGGGYPGTLEDVARAARALPEIARTHPIDLSRVVALGHSAGGQLALWVAGEQVGIHRVVALAPVTDLERASALGLGGGAVDAFLGGAAALLPEAVRAASPLPRLPIRLEQVLIHGEQDEDVPVALSIDYVDRARALGDPARLVLLPDVGHFELIDPRSSVWPRVLAAVSEV